MKKIVVLLAIAGSLLYVPASAQVRVNVNIGSQPVWGPVGYGHVDYYYLPDINTYYYVPTRQFIYPSNGRWIYSASLPSRYRSYDLYRGYKVVVNQQKPYLYDSRYRTEYSRYRNNYGQQMIIRNSNEPKYYVVKGHPKYKDRDRRKNRY